MSKKLPYARYLLIHTSTQRRIIEVPATSLSSLLRRCRELRLSGADMNEYHVVKNLIRKEWRPREGCVRRSYDPRDNQTYTIAELDALQPAA